ncbi:hypothetical protein DY000_02062495 [Brassica cretica]|uniref:CCHC-type domain-containing protein n=1 Tax=Brassica cretica TaxID=69181 RepID=A0ABQ7B2P6_BRACR|nr:hypothetical protein DY000_02062495 [Brassica cretica]
MDKNALKLLVIFVLVPPRQGSHLKRWKALPRRCRALALPSPYPLCLRQYPHHHTTTDRFTHERLENKMVQCYECNGFGHVRKECANLLKQKKRDDKNDTDDDSDDGEKLKNFVAFTTFVPGSKTESATGSAAGSASAFVSGSSCGGDDDAGSEDDDGGSFDLAGNYEKLYEHWLKLVETNSDLAKEKAKLEAQVAEALKYASEKEEEARHAVAQLAETQKGLRMLNNGMDQLDQLLSIGQSDRCGGYQGECSKAEGVFVSAGKTKDVATSATKPEVKMSAGNTANGKTAVKPATDVKNVTATRTIMATATATTPERVSGLKSGSQQRFRPVCHHCGVVGHIRPRCFKLLREKNQMDLFKELIMEDLGSGIRGLGDLITMEMVEWDFLLTLDDMDLHVSF